MNNLSDTGLIKFVNLRILVIIAAFAAVFFMITFSPVSFDTDLLMLYGFILAIFIAFVFTFNKSVKSTLIPFLMLIMISIFTFLDQKILMPFGINVKPHAIIMGFALLVAFYYIARNFKYMWLNFPAFKYLFVFFVLNIIYFFFYYSEFNISLYNAGHFTANFFYFEDFSNVDAKLIVFLNSLSALIAFSIGIMVFSDVDKQEEIEQRILKLIKLLVFLFAGYLALAVFLVFVNLNKFVFIDGRLIEDFLGLSSIALPLFLIAFIAFKYYLRNLKDKTNTHPVNLVIDFNILFITAITLLQAGKTNIISTMLSAGLLIFLLFRTGFRINLFNRSTLANKMV